MDNNGAHPAGLTGWLDSHPWLTYILIFIFMAYVYNKVFRTRRLPILKALIVYMLIALGAFILLAFEIDLNLPILYCLVIAVVLMFIVRIRYWIAARRKKDGGTSTES